MVPREEQVYKRRKKAGGICSNLPDPSQRSKKATHKDFCSKGGTDTLKGTLEPGTGNILNIYSYSWYICGFPLWLSSKESAKMQAMQIQSLGLGVPLEMEMATRFSILA